MPWWGATLIAAVATVAGVVIDAASGNNELTTVFAALYALGCVAAVLAVRHSGIFTAVVQPPLILFIAVPGAYFLFHRAEIDGVKDILINCGYPLIERFLLMFSTSVVVLLIGMARWYFGAADRAGSSASKAAVAGAGLLSGLGAALAAPFQRRPADEADEPQPVRVRQPRRHTVDRATSTKPPGERRSGERKPPGRSRHARPPLDAEAVPPRSGRRYASHSHTAAEASEPPARRRRTAPEPRPREWEPEAPAPRRRPSRYADAYETQETYASYEPRDSHEPYDYPRRDPYAPPPPSTHNPFSNVRYRGDPEGDDDDHRYRRPR